MSKIIQFPSRFARRVFAYFLCVLGLLLLSACKETQVMDSTSYQTESTSEYISSIPTENFELSTVPTSDNFNAEMIPTESTVPEMFTDIVTPYGDFRMSGYWSGELSVELLSGEPYIIRAMCQTGKQSKTHLFDLSFGEGEGEKLGYVTEPDGGFCPVFLQLGAVEPDANWTEEEQRDFYAMQAEVNSILDALNYTIPEIIETTGQLSTVEVPTSYFSLYYPETYAHMLRTEIREGETVVVSFYGTPEGQEELHLYDFVINGDNEVPVGYYTLPDGLSVGVDVCNVSEYSTEGWSDTACVQLYQMMECINDILLALEQTGAFTY